MILDLIKWENQLLITKPNDITLVCLSRFTKLKSLHEVGQHKRSFLSLFALKMQVRNLRQTRGPIRPLSSENSFLYQTDKLVRMIPKQNSRT